MLKYGNEQRMWRFRRNSPTAAEVLRPPNLWSSCIARGSQHACEGITGGRVAELATDEGLPGFYASRTVPRSYNATRIARAGR